MWFYGDLTKSHGWAVITGPPLHAETGLWRAPRGGHPSKNEKVWSKSVDGLRCVTESYWKTRSVFKIEKIEEILRFSSTRLGKYWCCCKELRPSSWRSACVFKFFFLSGKAMQLSLFLWEKSVEEDFPSDDELRLNVVNPFTPKISLVILLIVCHTVLMALVQRI